MNTIYVIHPTSQKAMDWVKENVPDCPKHKMNFTVEHRYFLNLLIGMLEAGLGADDFFVEDGNGEVLTGEVTTIG